MLCRAYGKEGVLYQLITEDHVVLRYSQPIVAVFFCALVLSPFGVAAEFQGLGDLPGGIYRSSPADVSADGRVVVGHSESRENALGDGREAFVWTPEEGMVGLGFLASNNSNASQAKAASSDGTVVMGLSRAAGSLANETFLWTSENGLQGIASPDDGPHSSGADLSGDGRIVVGTARGTPRGGDAENEVFRWVEDMGHELLGTIPWLSDPTDDVAVQAISRDGTTIVGTQNDGFLKRSLNYESFVWREETGFQRIVNPTPYHQNFAHAVSDDGAFVTGEIVRMDGDRVLSEAFIWTEEAGLIPLGPYHDGSDTTRAFAISGDGSVAAGEMRNPEVGTVAMIWDAYRGPRGLQELLATEFGLVEPLAGWSLVRPTAISQDGLTIVGDGINPDGASEAWRAVLDPLPTPNLIPGDANLDGIVNREDLRRLEANMGVGAFWYQGNFDGVGRVDENDRAILMANFIPEPSSLVIAAVILLWLGGHCSRRYAQRLR